MDLNFSNSELSMILTVLTRCDPAEVVTDIQTVRRKIIAYAEKQAQEQATQAASLPVMDSPSD